MDAAEPRPRRGARPRPRLHAGLLSPTIPACTSRPTAAPSPRRSRRWSPRGRSKSRISSSSATAWAASSPAAPASHAEEAGHAWRKKLDKLVFLGTPHHGAPLERIGNWVDVVLGKTPYAAAFAPARQDPQRRRHRPALRRPPRRGLAGPRPLRPRARSAPPRAPARRASPATPSPPPPPPRPATSRTASSATASSPSPARSAATRIRARDLNFPPDRQWVACETGHLDLLSRRDVYERMAGWLAEK